MTDWQTGQKQYDLGSRGHKNGGGGTDKIKFKKVRRYLTKYGKGWTYKPFVIGGEVPMLPPHDYHTKFIHNCNAFYLNRLNHLFWYNKIWIKWLLQNYTLEIYALSKIDNVYYKYLK